MRASACTAQCMHLREVWVRNAFVLARACNWVAGSTTSAKAARAAVLIRAAFVAISPIAPLPFPDSRTRPREIRSSFSIHFRFFAR